MNTTILDDPITPDPEFQARVRALVHAHAPEDADELCAALGVA